MLFPEFSSICITGLSEFFPQNNRNEEQWYKLAIAGRAASTITQLLNDTVSDKEPGNSTECAVWTLLLNEQSVSDALWYFGI